MEESKLLFEILDFNRKFVKEEKYEPFVTTKFPNKRLVIVSCMDTRLVELLPQSLNLRNGDAKIIKNAGAIIAHPFGSIMRSLIVAVYQLQADEIFVIAHHDCGMHRFEGEKLLGMLEERGVDPKIVDTLQHSGINLNQWLKGFDNVNDNVRNSVEVIRNHPLMPKDIAVHGLVIDPGTGRLDLVINGYEMTEQPT
jgi:carbonic anhydrase